MVYKVINIQSKLEEQNVLTRYVDSKVNLIKNIENLVKIETDLEKDIDQITFKVLNTLYKVRYVVNQVEVISDYKDEGRILIVNIKNKILVIILYMIIIIFTENILYKV